MRARYVMVIGWTVALGSASGCSRDASNAAQSGITQVAAEGASGTSAPRKPAASSGDAAATGSAGTSGMASAGNGSPSLAAGRLGSAASESAGAAGHAAQAGHSGQGAMTGKAGETAQASAAAGASGHAAAGEGSEPAAASGVLPPVRNLEEFGSFTPVTVSGTGPDSGYRLDYPQELGKDGLKHPCLVFAAGGGFPENYNTLLKYVTSHGFVVLSYAATDDQGKQVLAGIDWLTAQHAAASGMLSGKLDPEHIAAAGHSFGSLAVFNAATDPRITTTIHLQGGTLDPHAEVANLRAPAEFICGESPTGDQDGTFTGDMANPNCAVDFDKASVPVFYGSLTGAAHIQLTEAVDDPNDPLRMRMLGAIGGWLRWRLAGDESQRARYVGDDCELCKPDTGWTIKQKGL